MVRPFCICFNCICRDTRGVLRRILYPFRRVTARASRNSAHDGEGERKRGLGMGFHRVNYTIFAALHVGFRGRFPPLLILLRLKAAITAPVFCANNIAKGLAVLYPNLQQTGFIVTCPGVCPQPLFDARPGHLSRQRQRTKTTAGPVTRPAPLLSTLTRKPPRG